MNSMRSTWKSKRLHHLPLVWLRSLSCRQQGTKSMHLRSKARCTLNGVLQSSLHSSNYRNRTSPLCIDPVITEALWNKEPVVALESTIITHGMPFPHNIEYDCFLIIFLNDSTTCFCWLFKCIQDNLPSNIKHHPLIYA